ncbi:MAG: DUF488 family protein [Thermodesulfobacteriota bacterium]
MCSPDTYRCGGPRRDKKRLLIGTVRYPPRGVKKADYARLGYYDVWFPVLAPSKELIKEFKSREQGTKTYAWFKREYKRELKVSTEARDGIALVAEVAKRLPVSIGCYCEDENYCHRKILLEEILKSK